jgi:hypothetical protein
MHSEIEKEKEPEAEKFGNDFYYLVDIFEKLNMSLETSSPRANIHT